MGGRETTNESAARPAARYNVLARPEAAMSTPRPSNVLMYVFVAVVALGGLGFLYLLFGEAFIFAIILIVGIVGVGTFHWLLWGRSMTQQTAEERTEEPTE